MAVAIALLLVLVVASGCGSGAPSPSPPSAASPVAATVPWDDDLLAILPAEVDGLPMNPEAGAFAASASDAGLVRDAEAGAVGFVVAPATGDYAVAFVYELRPGVYDEDWFRAWRDSFDAGVCEQAGGVTGHAESQLGGHTVYIGSCAGGVLTYHAHLETETGDVIVSCQSLGDRRFGEQVMAGLRP